MTGYEETDELWITTCRDCDFQGSDRNQYDALTRAVGHDETTGHFTTVVSEDR